MNSTCTVVCILIAGEYSQHFAMLPLVFLEMMSEEGVACKAGVFLTEAQMYINRGCHFDLTSPLESFFDLPQLSVSFNVQDDGRTSVSSFTSAKYPCFTG